MRRRRTSTAIHCLNPFCRTNKKAKAGSEFCPACRGQIALKYETRHSISIKKAKIVVMVHYPETISDDEELGNMYKKAEPIEIQKFLRRVPLAYLNAYFRYKSARSKGLMFKDDISLKFFESKYLGCNVMIIEKDEIHYVFAQPLVFAAAILNSEPPQIP